MIYTNRQLAHCDNDTVRRAYPRGEYWEERVRMMQHWSDCLDTSGDDRMSSGSLVADRTGRHRQPVTGHLPSEADRTNLHTNLGGE